MSCEKLMNGYSAPIIYILYHSILLSFLKPAANFIYSIKLVSLHTRNIYLLPACISQQPAACSQQPSFLATRSSKLAAIAHPPSKVYVNYAQFVLYIAARSVRLWKSSVYLKYTLKGGCHDYLAHFCEHSDVILL